MFVEIDSYFGNYFQEQISSQYGVFFRLYGGDSWLDVCDGLGDKFSKLLRRLFMFDYWT